MFTSINAVLKQLNAEGWNDITLEYINKGVMTDTYKMHTKTKKYVVRCYPNPRRWLAEVEYSYLIDFAKNGIKAPLPVCTNKTESKITYLIYEWVEGETLNDKFTTLNENELNDICIEVICNYQKINKIKVNKYGGVNKGSIYGYNSWSHFIKAEIEKSRKYFKQTKNIKFIKICNGLFDYVDKIKEPSPCLVWSDFSFDNIIKQISFTMDFDTSIKGYASPLIWGVYGDKNKGVCIELDYEKLNLPSSYFCDIVEYTNNTNHRIKISNDVVSVTSLKSFIREHQKELFFLKDKCWEYENEYRIISDSDEYLDISNAITAVYVADLDGLAFEIVDAMLKNTDVTFGYVHLDKDSGVLFSSDARLYKDSINSPLSDPRNCLLSISKQAKEHYESLKKHPDADLTKVEYKI